MPSVGLETLLDVLGEAFASRTVQTYRVLIVQIDEIAEPEMPRQGGGLAGNAFHQVPVAHQAEDPIVQQPKVFPIVPRGEILLRDCHPHAVTESLSEGARSGLHSCRQAMLGMPGCPTPPLAETLDFLHGQVVTREVKERIKKHRPVTR